MPLPNSISLPSPTVARSSGGSRPLVRLPAPVPIARSIHSVATKPPFIQRMVPVRPARSNFAFGGGTVVQGVFRGRPVIQSQAVKGFGDAQHVEGRVGVVQPNGTSNAFQVPPNLLRTSGGQSLPESVQQKMESVFGTNFSDVRIHVSHQAAAIGALAFTRGSSIYFAPGLYSPTTHHGQRLLGHELTHVVQQRAGRVRNPFGSGVAVVQDAAMEAEADRMGVRAAMAPAPIQRKSNPTDLRRVQGNAVERKARA